MQIEGCLVKVAGCSTQLAGYFLQGVKNVDLLVFFLVC